jgi:hypothetical protein
VPHTEELPGPNPPEYLLLAITILILIEITESKKGVMLNANEIEESCSSSDHHLLKQGHLNDLLRDLNLFKKTRILGVHTER